MRPAVVHQLVANDGARALRQAIAEPDRFAFTERRERLELLARVFDVSLERDTTLRRGNLPKVVPDIWHRIQSLTTPRAMEDRSRMPKDRPEPNAAELLGDWRAAERDTVAAKVAQTVAELALKAASAAEEAAMETERAALVALDAAKSAQAAAAQAKKAAMQASEASTLLTAGAEGDKARANQSLVQAEEAEAAARDRFHDAESKGFPKKP